MLVVTGDLGAPVVSAIALLSHLATPVIIVLAPGSEEGPFDQLLTEALTASKHTNVFPLANSMLVYQGVRFLGVLEEPLGYEGWLEDALTVGSQMPAVVISSSNPFEAEEDSFFAGKRLRSTTPAGAAVNSCYAWIHGNTPLASMRLSSEGVALVACSGHMSRPAFGDSPLVFDLYTIREQLQLSALNHIRAVLRASIRALEGRLGHDRDGDELALMAYDAGNNVSRCVQGQPFLNARCTQGVAAARACFTQGEYEAGVAHLASLANASDDELMFNRSIVAEARAKALSLVEALLNAEGVRYVVHPLNPPQAYCVHNQPLRVQALGGTDKGTKAALDRFLASVAAAAASLLRQEYSTHPSFNSDLPVEVLIYS